MTSAFEDLENRFTYHPASPGQAELYEHLRGEALKLAKRVHVNCPESRERSLAITHLEEAVFWANAAIARHS